MRVQLIAALALAAGAAQAQPVSERPPTWTIQCIDVSGATEPARCNVPPSRVDQSEFICTCPAGGMRTRVPICAPGQKPPAENVALNRVRREASRDGSLEGDRVGDRPICVAPRRP
jgi:hypothetical protein